MAGALVRSGVADAGADAVGAVGVGAAFGDVEALAVAGPGASGAVGITDAGDARRPSAVLTRPGTVGEPERAGDHPTAANIGRVSPGGVACATVVGVAHRV